MAFRNPQDKQITARALTDPKPRFVSLVAAGANQTPIKSIKMDIVQLENEAMTQVQALRADGLEVARMVFRTGEDFADGSAVHAFLTEGGYPLDDLETTKTGFELLNKADDFEGDLKVIKINDGLTVWVGKLEAPEPVAKDADAEAVALANNAGSVITSVEVINTEKTDADADATKGEGEGEGEEEDTEGQLTHGLDGSLKPRTRTRKVTSVRQVERDGADGDAGSAGAEAEGDAAKQSTDAEKDAAKSATAAEKDADCGCDKVTKASAEDCGPDEKFLFGKCVKKIDAAITIHDMDFEPLSDAEAREHKVPMGSFPVDAERVDLIQGDCGNAHTLMSVGGMSFCVPTGDKSPIANPTEVSPSNPAGGQGAAGFGSTSPSSGQTLRLTDDRYGIKAKFDEFSAFFSDDKTLEGVMEDADDGFPPGLQEVITAAVTAMRNGIMEGDMDAVRQVGADLGDVAAALATLFGTVAAERRAKAIDLASGTFAELGWPTPGTNEDQPSSKTDEALATLATAMTSMVDVVKQVQADVSTVKDGQSELSSRVEKVEGVANRQTRKGATDEGQPNGSPKKSPLGDIALRGALGISAGSV